MERRVFAWCWSTARIRSRYRSAHLRWRHPCTYHCRARRQLYPGAARHTPRSNHYTPLRMTSWHCSRLVLASCGHPNDPLRDADEFTPHRVPEDVPKNALVFTASTEVLSTWTKSRLS